MNIVVLDGYTLNPGDLDWQPLKELGEIEIHDRTAPNQVPERARHAGIVLTNKTVLSEATLDQLPNLRYIGVLATGYDVIDIEAARARNITVANVPAYGADSVAQMVFAHILNVCNNVDAHATDVARGGWSSTEDYCYWLTPQTELAGKILGIVGYGEIGKATARLAAAFQMEVLIHTRTVPPTLPDGIRHVELEELLASADFISLHCPLTDRTRHLINRETIALMQPHAVLINCSRGPLVDEPALAEALNSALIAGACLDVLSREPADSSNPLIGARNCRVTPHIAWATREARRRLLGVAVDNIRAFLAGERSNCVT